MYPKFIEVHAAGDGIAVSINVENVIGIGRYEEYGCLRTMDETMWQTKESYDELKDLITDSGCLIKKADPRLDTEHPLTMEDLRTMVGEPVWNSNLNVWLLVKECSDLYVDLLWTSGNTSSWDEEELKSFPLYRMRK